MNNDLDIIKARIDEASPGPWRALSGAKQRAYASMGYSTAAVPLILGNNEHVLGELSAWVDDGDRDLIVNARADIEWLISEVERLRDIEAAAFMKGHDHGRDIERGFTTAWLRRGDACCVEDADRIARGEHRGEDK
jgi:hypothetical protein